MSAQVAISGTAWWPPRVAAVSSLAEVPCWRCPFIVQPGPDGGHLWRCKTIDASCGVHGTGQQMGDWSGGGSRL
jgi:hypothetical protein